MPETLQSRSIYIGIGLAVLATIIWSGNFIIARGIIHRIPPFSLAFYRWLTASIIILPLAIKKFNGEKIIVLKNWKYLFWVALTGITLFNTLVYIAGHYSSAINLALIGTTSSPVFAILLAAVFLKEKIKALRILGMIVCISGIVVLLSEGSFERLIHFHFSTGDWWILGAALSFAIYNTLVRKKPASITPVNFLFVVFSLGTILLFPFYIWEGFHTDPVVWDVDMILIVLYLGIGASVICYLFWNAAIARLGSARTALFGNLIPVFSTLEAVLILHEEITVIHIISGLLVVAGLVIANLQKSNSGLTQVAGQP
ncbi:MAG: DMT family transporter [Chitinophagaceae bacterium]|nr:DMT family transporter [Chitinophagaceae bacterium]